eukprot:CAMPEP_0197030290 /NCGR_PEP_ID=MMETSP1384-20130603/9553_1 /TAXON_ID=29189 /ORGANISM="Ammonia sp." /LENGTH=161 /DNA_ID=CAMNT_0042459607 /DNA_START=147 /DNA_END=632 /DNA_ORIENTATION=-
MDHVPPPTVGFNVQTIRHKKRGFVVYDLGGQETTRALWQHYYEGAKAIVFVIDATDTERMVPKMYEDQQLEDKRKYTVTTTVKMELIRLIKEPALKACKTYLIYANKQDLKHSLSALELEAKLNLTGVDGKNVHFQASSAKTGEGIKEGLDWLVDALYSGK